MTLVVPRNDCDRCAPGPETPRQPYCLRMPDVRRQLAILTLAAVAVAGCGGAVEGSGDETQPEGQGVAASQRNTATGDRRPNTDELKVEARLPAEAVVHSDPKDGVKMTVPAQWNTTRRSLTPMLGNGTGGGRAGSVAAGTVRLRPDRGMACSDSPAQPQVEIGPTDALVHVGVQPNQNSAGGDGRPRPFRLLEQVRPVEPERPRSGQVFPWNCLDRVGISGIYTFFGADRRVFYVTAVVGEEAPDSTRSEVLGVLESLELRGD